MYAITAPVSFLITLADRYIKNLGRRILMQIGHVAMFTLFSVIIILLLTSPKQQQVISACSILVVVFNAFHWAAAYCKPEGIQHLSKTSI